MSRHIVVIQGHPDARPIRFCHALADAYVAGARAAGHKVRVIDVGALDFPVLRTQEDWSSGKPLPAIRDAQATIAWAHHLVILFPLWLGTMPALLKAFLEQVFRPGFAISDEQGGRMWKKLLIGKSARIVVTMGMPALVYRWYFRAHGVKSLERNVLRFSGIAPIKETLIGGVADNDPTARTQWLARLEALGREGG
jgi:putative NADPH-quinone reductase